MAITGTGTQSDPWITQNYTDLASAFSLANGGAGNYIKLDDFDIDCNTYGSSFEWETLSLSNASVWVDLDLNGHAVKNVKVASNNYMFSTGTGAASTIHNGQILNVFTSNASGFVSCAEDLHLEELSLSLNGTGATSYFSNRAYYTNCAVYFEASKLDYMPFMNYDQANTLFTNCDIQFAIDNINGQRLIGKDTNYGGTTSGLDSCRLRGYIKGSTAANCVIGMCSMSNSVCDLDMLQATPSGSGNVFSGGTGVLNTDKIVAGMALTGSIVGVDSQQIVNGAALREAGFVVVNVVG